MFGIVLGLITWIYLGALVFVVAAEVSAVRAQRLWPRSLLTPFTDRVRLSWADRRAYESYAAAAAFYTAGAMMLEQSFGGRVILPMGRWSARGNLPGHLVTRPVGYAAGMPRAKVGQ